MAYKSTQAHACLLAAILPWILVMMSHRHTCALTVVSRQFDCTATSIDLEVTLRDPFYGAAYSFGEFDQPNCRVTGTGTRRMRVSLALDDCGTNVIGPGRYEVNVVIQANEKVIMNGDLSYKLICQYDLQDKTINSDINIDPNIPGQPATYEGQGPAPTVFLRILSGAGTAGSLSSKAEVGDDMTIDLVLADTSIYTNFVVKKCYAHNKAVRLELIDSVGCVSNQAVRVVRGQVESEVEGARLHKYIVFEAFKFPEGDIVHFQCIVTLCLQSTGSCPEQCDRERRRRRKREELGEAGVDYHDPVSTATRDSQVSGAIVVSAPAIDPRTEDASSGVSSEATGAERHVGLVCVSLVEFSVGVSLVIGVALLCAILTMCLCSRLRRGKKGAALLEQPGADSPPRIGRRSHAFTITGERAHSGSAATSETCSNVSTANRPAPRGLEPLHIPRPDY